MYRITKIDPIARLDPYQLSLMKQASRFDYHQRSRYQRYLALSSFLQHNPRQQYRILDHISSDHGTAGKTKPI